MKKISVGLGVAFSIFASMVHAQQLPATSLKVLGGNQTQNMFRYIEKPFFTKELGEKSNGSITTTFGSLEELGIKGPEVLPLLRLGVFDIAEGTLSYMAGEDPRFDGLDLPVSHWTSIPSARRWTLSGRCWRRPWRKSSTPSC